MVFLLLLHFDLKVSIFDENPFPASIEIIKSGKVEDHSFLLNLKQRVSKIKGNGENFNTTNKQDKADKTDDDDDNDDDDDDDNDDDESRWPVPSSPLTSMVSRLFSKMRCCSPTRGSICSSITCLARVSFNTPASIRDCCGHW